MTEKTLDGKRSFAREHLASQAKEARDQETYHTAVAKGRSTFAVYCDRRAATVEQIEEIELDLMIAQWRAETRAHRAWVETRREGYTQENLFRRYDAPVEPIFVATEPPKDPT